MNTELQAALLRVVNQIHLSVLPRGCELREQADIITITKVEPTDDRKADFLLYAMFYCREQSRYTQRCEVERAALESLAETCRIEIKRLIL